MYIWVLLVTVSLILLAKYWNSRNAVWGGLTLGVIIGVLWKIFGGTDWYIVAKTIISGTLLGFGAELLGMSGDYFIDRRMKKDPLSQLTNPNNKFVKALKWLEGEIKLQKEFDKILKRYGKFDDQNRAQEWLLEKYRNRIQN